MSGLHKQYKTNNIKEVEGIEVQFPEAQNDDGTIPTFVLSRMGKSNKAYTKALEAATRPYRRQMELKTLKEEIAESLFMEVFVNTILKGWRNVQNENGEPIPFSKVTAVGILSELPDVFDRLQEEAKLASNFRDESLEEEAKNS